MEIDLSSVAPEDLPRVKQLLAEVAEHQKYGTYLPKFFEDAYPWQQKVAEFTKDHTVIGTIAANRVGKSEVGCAIVACHLIGYYPPWYNGKKFNKPVKVMAACLNSDLNKSVLQSKLFGSSNWRMKSEIGTGMIPRELINFKSCVSGRGDGIDKISIKHKSGGWSELYFRAYAQGREAAQGVEADVVLIDEQPKDDFWSECMTRLATTGGHAICSFTPLEGLTGLVEELIGLTPIEDSPEDKFGSKYKSEAGWAMVRASWDDIEHIPEDTKEILKKGYLPYESDARVYGMPIAGHGAIFPHLERDITYSPREVQINPTWSHMLAIDIGHGHGRDPSAAVQVVWDEDSDKIYITDCKMEETNTTLELSRLIGSVNHKVPVMWPNDASKANMNAESTVAEQLQEMQINLTAKPFLNPRGPDGKRDNRKAQGIQHINQRFSEGKLLISTDCEELLHEIKSYSYTETGKIQDGRDHCIDAMRYGVMSIIQGLGAPFIDYGFNDYDDEEFTYNSY